MIAATFRIGATMAFAVDLPTGDPALVNAMACSILLVAKDNTLALDAAAGTKIALTVTAYAAAGDASYPAGWACVLPAASTVSLAPGIYAVDIKATLTTGEQQMSDRPQFLRVTRAAVA